MWRRCGAAAGGGSPEVRRLTPSGTVPYLEHGGARIWESLAILEYCAEIAPALWPADRVPRAHARAIAAEMHAGFRGLRMAMPMNILREFPGQGRTPDALADIARIEAIWAEASPPMAAPSCSARSPAGGCHVRPGGLALPHLAARTVRGEPRYVAALRAHPLMERWHADAAAEPAAWLLDKYETGMSATAAALDHVGIAARISARWPPPISGWASRCRRSRSNRAAPGRPAGGALGLRQSLPFLEHGYIELIAILDPALFDNTLNRFLTAMRDAHPGAGGHGCEANLPRLRAAGIDTPASPGGTAGGGRWADRQIRPPALPDPPEAGCAHPAPHPGTGRQRRWMAHANQAVALEEAVLCAAAPAETGARLSRLAGCRWKPARRAGADSPARRGPRAGPFAPAMETRIRILAPEALPASFPAWPPPGPALHGRMLVRTADGAACRAAGAGRAATRAAPAGVMVPPEHAGGTAVIFA